MYFSSYHFVHGDVVGKHLGDDVSIWQKYVADSLDGEWHKKTPPKKTGTDFIYV